MSMSVAHMGDMISACKILVGKPKLKETTWTNGGSVWTGLDLLRRVTIAGSCEHDNETSLSIESMEFLEERNEN
jgi:hypothetical protein